MSQEKVIGQLGRLEFIVLVGALIAINAFAIDIMLPGLQQIGESLGEADENRRQLVIPAYMLGFGLFQLVFGPLADRFGRKPPLLAGMAIYGVAALSAYFVTDFNTLVVLRFLQGAGAAASAVIAVALVRDCFVGDQMAKTLSLVFMVIMLSPIFAPALGQLLMKVMDWRALFVFMAIFCAIIAAWLTLRMPETLKPEHRRAFTLKSIVEGFAVVFGNRISLAYILGTAMLFGGLMGFLMSSQQIYVEHFGMGDWFPALFAAGGAVSAFGGFLNSQLVTKFGMRKLSHNAQFVFFGVSLVTLVLGLVHVMPVAVFFALMCAIFLTFNFIMSNFGALAMMPLGEVAGTAASTQGFLQMVIGVALGTVIGQFYNGTTVPLAIGLTLLSGIGILIVSLGAKASAPHAQHT
jgi:MFS transporter, DHA1 family, multidrug resistance protein